MSEKDSLSYIFLQFYFFWRKDSDNISIIQICVTHFCIISNNNGNYAQSFGFSEQFMNGRSDKEEAASSVYNASLPFLKGDERERVKGQLSNIAKDMKEERQQNQSRGFHI